MEQKLQGAIEHIEAAMRNCRSPFMLWSGGKDSMALLHILVHQVGTKLPVVFFREPWQPWKYEFQNDIIEKWGLEAYTFHPRESKFQQTDDEFEIQNYYWLNNTLYTCPTGITKPEQGQAWHCALDMVRRPKQIGLVAEWDLGFVGHKACDSDPIYGGDAGTRIDFMLNPGGIAASYPIRGWTHDDVFAYCEQYDVPIQTNRYEKVNGKWRESEDRAHNCDYVHACTRCIDRREDKFVWCPKLNMTVATAKDQVQWADQTIPQYMED